MLGRPGYAVGPIYSTLGVAAFGVIYDTSKEDELRTDANTCYAERKCAEDPTRDFCAKPPPEGLQ